MTGLAFLKNILFLFNVCSKCFDFLLQLLLPSYFWTVVLETTLENTLGSKEIKPVHPKGNQSWLFIGRTDAEAEVPILWPPDVKNWLLRKDSDAGKEWTKENKGTKEDQMIGCITNSIDLNLCKLQVLVMDRKTWDTAVHGVTKCWTQLTDWTELNWTEVI